MKSPWSFPTSPRSPYKVIERLKLISSLDGKEYDTNLQIEIGKRIREESENLKVGLSSNSSTLDFVGRDYITRAPKKLGIVYVPGVGKGKFELTEQGRNLINSKNMEFVMQRQIAKIQYPSPIKVRGTEKIKLIPLTATIKILKSVKDLSRSEVMMFVITIENFSTIDQSISEILKFRENLKKIKGNLKRRKFRDEVGIKKLNLFYKNEDFSIREKKGKKVDKSEFLRTKLRNHKDYADSIFRYFISTGLFKLNKKSRLEISKINEKDADYLLETIGLEPKKFDNDEKTFVKDYMGKENSISLYTDKLDNLLNKFDYLKKLSSTLDLKINTTEIDKRFKNEKSLDIKKDIIVELQKKFIYLKMEKFIKKLSERKKNDFDEIVGHFEEISDRNSEILDKPLQYEYNFFRAFSFIGDAEKIIPSLNFDEDINPLNTTSNKPDLIIEYKDFILVVEVTLSAGQRQYESEGAPVFRHVGKCQNENNKPVFGLFICEKMDVNMPIEFLSRAMVKTKIYNGRVRILPIERSDFNLLFEKIYNEELKSDYLFGMFNSLLDDNALNKYQEQGEEDWINDFKANLS
tara:strand:- start:77 stop:1807 length:1731 start_codon:yes stop_codon:yes gene_type:complete